MVSAVTISLEIIDLLSSLNCKGQFTHEKDGITDHDTMQHKSFFPHHTTTHLAEK